MLKIFRSPFLVIAILLGGFSTFLAYKGEYEAAMAGAGVTVAIATARNNKDEDSGDSDETTQIMWYREQCEELRNEMRERDKILRWEKEKLMQLIERAEDVRRHEREMMQEIAQLKGDLSLLNQRFEQQAKIKEMELEIERLKTEKHLLLEQKELRSLPASRLEVFEVGIQKMQEAEKSENCEDL
ncbi:MAG: hypothetical protein RMZ41_030690 [Nostoc sp. DedVER02]|uniref:hypothetical protein n=1 Tax=unclassified Nostoc TaxID=2593658 RepID=UPI002AD57D2E|nr:MULTISPECIES: hypothetical protein [unclassified Nostoc]MDZ7984434.1 hypothetical protein [Nostoc sp. DedVER02]MDZ8110765.1 hypothetical protein [Nostoc sp. DedVER01b]